MVRIQSYYGKGLDLFFFFISILSIGQISLSQPQIPGFPKTDICAFLKRWWHTWCKFTNYRTQAWMCISNSEALGLNLKRSGTKDKIIFDFWTLFKIPAFFVLFVFSNHNIVRIKCKLNIFHVNAFFPSEFSMMYLTVTCQKNFRV